MVPATAAADSLVYIAGGNVWLTTTDGARQFQVTSDGGWDYASQSDTGVLVASKGTALYRLAPTGEVLGRLSTVTTFPFYGPYDPQVSPDGRRVAYGYYHQGSGVSSGVMYTNTDGTSIPDAPLHSGWMWPAWIDNEYTLHSERPNALSETLIVRGVGEPNNVGRTWDENNGHNLYDADIKPGVIVGVANDGADLNVYRYTGEPGAEPSTIEGCASYTGPTGKFESPSLSPDGRTVVWNEGDGVWIGALADLSGGCAPSQNGRLLIPGGRFPDWGGAAVPPARVPAPPPGGGAAPTPPPPPAPLPPVAKPRGSQAAPITLAGSTKLARALSKGLVVQVGGASGTVRVTASVSAAVAKKAGLGRKAVTVASGSAKARGGKARVTLKFTKAKARKLRRLRSLPLTLRLADGRTKTVTLKN